MMSGNSIEFSSLEAEASSEITPVPRLTELAGQSLELARIVAKNLNASPNLLAELSGCEDRLTRQNVAENPNTSFEVLFKLGAEFPDEFLDNPIFPLLSLENPNWIERLPVETLRPLLICPRGQQELLERFLNYPESQTRAKCLYFLSLKDCPAHWLERFSDSIYDDVRRAIASNPLAPISILEKLARDSSLIVRLSTIINRNLPASSLTLLARSPYPDVRCQIVVHPKVTASLIQELSRDSDRSVRQLIASDPTIPTSILEEFASDPETEVRQALSGNIHAPLAVLKKLARDRVAAIRCRVAQNLKTPKAILINLAADRKPLVRFGVASNPNTPIAILKILSADTSRKVRVAVATNERTPKVTLKSLTSDSDNLVSQTACKQLKARKSKAAHRKADSYGSA